MRIKTLLTAYAAVSLFVGLSFTLAPDLVLGIYQLEMNELGIYVSRVLGAALLGLAVLSWSTRKAGPSSERDAVLLSLFVFESLGFLFSLTAQLSGVLGPLGWSFVILFLVFAAALGYARFVSPGSE